MKLSNETTSMLKNFATINQSILFRPGKELRTISAMRNVLAQATIEEEIPREFAIHDLNQFLGVMSMYKDSAELTFDDNNVIFSGLGGRSRIKYRTAAKETIVTPDKAMNFPEAEVTVTLTESDFEWVLQTSRVLGSTAIGIESDGTKVTVSTFDPKDDSAALNTLNLDIPANGTYKFVFNIDNIKLIPGAYTIKISSKGISHFQNVNKPVQYWIATESASFQG